MNSNLIRAVGVLIALVAVATGSAQQPDADAVVLKLNGEPIYFWEVAVTVPQVQMEMLRQGIQPEREMVVNASMKRVVDTHLLAAEARGLGLKADAARVDAGMAQLVEQAGGRENFEATLAGMGISSEELRESASESDLVQVYVETVIDPMVAVTADEVVTFYRQNPEMFDRPEMVRALHIVIRIGQGADQAEKDAAKARADAARHRVLEGEDFSKVAAEVSEGREAANGGDLGFFPRDGMVPAISNAAFSLDVGEVSQVAESQFGFHFVKVMEKRGASTMTFDEAKEPLEEMLRENKAGELVAKKLAELTEKASIVEVPPPAGAQSGADGG